jgi:hypothetical protein
MAVYDDMGLHGVFFHVHDCMAWMVGAALAWICFIGVHNQANLLDVKPPRR